MAKAPRPVYIPPFFGLFVAEFFILVYHRGRFWNHGRSAVPMAGVKEGADGMVLPADNRPVTEYFGENVFDDRVMRERLPKETYRALREVMRGGKQLDAKLAEVVAGMMKDWAVSKGATHYTHWFQPLSGSTAEKHESFIAPTGDGGAIMEFSGKMLIKGESDASSFPSGGLRQTFEARGYTMWDCTSPAFLKEDTSGVTLCIPTAFCSYGGEALDEKTPLLRSLEALNRQALRVLRQFGDHQVRQVNVAVGAEQEYFLIDVAQYVKRPDLVVTGRTLFGAKPSKCQDLDDHYFGSIKERISLFMKELDEELWKMGVSAKTKHNEVAPAQFELAPLYSAANIAADQNQLIMETMKRVARRHSLVCLLHEKPFAYINGSGKHNNWSVVTDTGLNLFEPGDTPYENAKFLLFVCAVIKSIDRHAGLLRLSAASAGNDRRLGACEAPPAIISVSLGEDILDVIRRVSDGLDRPAEGGRVMDFGVPTLPKLSADAADRNRTSPFAFTGNKFEFRMLGSSMTVSWANTVLNTIFAQTLGEYAGRLEQAGDFDREIVKIVHEAYHEHGRVIFGGNGYAEEWVEEAARRGLPNLTNTVDAAQVLLEEQTVELFESCGVYSREELHARYEVILDVYTKRVLIEARTASDIAARQLVPAVDRVMAALAEETARLEGLGLRAQSQRVRLQELGGLLDELAYQNAELVKLLAAMDADPCESLCAARACRDEVLPRMDSLRVLADRLEAACPLDAWPLPSYQSLLFEK